jgi:hypothetical protein
MENQRLKEELQELRDSKFKYFNDIQNIEEKMTSTEDIQEKNMKHLNAIVD